MDEYLTRMDFERLVESQGTIVVPEEDLLEIRNEGGTT